MIRESKMSKVRERYGIAEWFGNDITKLSDEERQAFGLLAIRQEDAPDPSLSPICPYLSTLIPSARCNKASGVCSIRKYSEVADGIGATVPGDKVVTVCPSRFLQSLTDGKTLFSWIAENMLGVTSPTIVKETPFLRKINEATRSPDIAADMEEEALEEGKKAGRIDWILVNPGTMTASELDWCAVETQALYFSGLKMRHEFNAYADAPSPILFPRGQRRPDYRSSGPKRLAPQLDVKVPVLRNWGKKVVVVVDRFFFNNMNSLIDAYPRAKTDAERRDNADVVWFIIDYDEKLNMFADRVVYTSLESSRHALNATEPLSKGDFTKNLKQVIDKSARNNKVFRTSE